MNRRLFVAAVGATGLGATAGCLDRILADATTFAASPAVVSDAAADEVGYEYRGTTETVETESVAGETVEATNYGSEYTRTIDAPLGDLEGETETETGVFGIVTTPKVSVAGEDFNPVGDMSRAEIALEVQHRYDDLAIDDEPIGRRTVETLGAAITIETFEGEASFREYDAVDVYLDVSQPDHGDDHLVIAAIYPDAQGFDRESEAERVETLIQGIEHGDDVDADVREA